MPKLPPSAIFESYAKIAKDKGLLKTAQAKESKELKEYKDAVYPRVGSDTISTIEALYGVKPDRPKSMDYEHNISENAHPNSLVIAPAYDRLNGLVENINERQRILINIMQKPVNGHLTQKRYASALMNELVKAATDLDNHDIAPLRELADTCITQLNKQAILPAAAPFAFLGIGLWGWAAISASVLGAAYLFNHINDPDKGLVHNLDNALEKLDALIGEDWFHQTFYASLKPEYISKLKKFKADLQSLKTAAEDFNKIEANLHQLKTLEELVATAKDSGQETVHKAEEFRHFLTNIDPEIKQMISELADTHVNDMQIKDETWLSKITKSIEPVLHGGAGLFADRFASLKQALEPLQKSIDDTFAEIDQIDNMQQNRTQHIASQLQQAEQHARKIETPELGQSSSQPDKMEDFTAKLHELLGK